MRDRAPPRIVVGKYKTALGQGSVIYRLPRVIGRRPIDIYPCRLCGNAPLASSTLVTRLFLSTPLYSLVFEHAATYSYAMNSITDQILSFGIGSNLFRIPTTREVALHCVQIEERAAYAAVLYEASSQQLRINRVFFLSHFSDLLNARAVAPSRRGVSRDFATANPLLTTDNENLKKKPFSFFLSQRIKNYNKI